MPAQWILMPVHNNLRLTMDSVNSCLAQDIGDVRLLIIDDASNDGTEQYLRTLPALHRNVYTYGHGRMQGVSKAWNSMLEHVFTRTVEPAPHALVVNNDIRLAPWFYRMLTARPELFVTGISVGRAEENVAPSVITTSPHPDFSAYLIRRECWERVGRFDERMVFYASDGDMHIRMNRAGIRAVSTNIPFLHFRSSTLKLAPPEERDAFCRQADADRATFQSIYGFPMWGAEYDAACGVS